MKKIIFILLSFLLLSYSGFAKKLTSVSYSYNPLKYEGCEVLFSITHADSLIQLTVTIKTSNAAVLFPENPIMNIRFFNGKDIAINGSAFGTQKESHSMPVVSPYGSYSISSNYVNSIAIFPLSTEQIDMFATGVKKIRFNTIPALHEREFKKDKIGANIYKMYLQTLENKDF